MYIQITTRCNMECEHCCMSATAKGEDMSIGTFKNALEYDEYITIGGGEPTLHPKFWEMMGLALGFGEYVWLATNGSITKETYVRQYGNWNGTDFEYSATAGRKLSYITNTSENSKNLLTIIVTSKIFV